MKSKPCSVCGEIKRLDWFYVHRGTKDGRTHSCGKCIYAARVDNYRQVKRYKAPIFITEYDILGDWHSEFCKRVKEFRTRTEIY